MGRSHSTTHTVEYRTDPALLQLVKAQEAQLGELNRLTNRLQEDYKNALQQAKALQKPEAYQKLKEQAFMAFVNNLDKLKFTDAIPRKPGHRHHAVIGNISAGKSSLLNLSLKLKLEVGLGECTSEVTEVAQSESGLVHIWDCPGVNDAFSIFDPEQLSFFHCADRIFILYCDTPKNCREIIVVLAKVKSQGGLYLVRTKCDSWDKSHAKSVAEELETDRQLLKKWGLSVQVLATSAKMGMDFEQNARFTQLLRKQ